MSKYTLAQERSNLILEFCSTEKSVGEVMIRLKMCDRTARTILNNLLAEFRIEKITKPSTRAILYKSTLDKDTNQEGHSTLIRMAHNPFGLTA